MRDLIEDAPAKVNLYLHVVGRRADGYHLLDSMVVFPAIGDTVTATPDNALALTVAGPLGAALAHEPDNLVLRAAHLLAESAGMAPQARLVLEKNLPVASGIGGGSADAAAALRVLSRLWNVEIPSGLALRLGADVPVCLASRPMRMGGIGEVLTSVPDVPACGIVLVNPGVAVATPAVFRARTGGFSAPAEMPGSWTDASAFVAWLAGHNNDLEAPAISICATIATVLAALRATEGCQLARMSGSGATCFGLFDTAVTAEAAACGLRRAGWWVWGGAMKRAGVAECV